MSGQIVGSTGPYTEAAFLSENGKMRVIASAGEFGWLGQLAIDNRGRVTGSVTERVFKALVWTVSAQSERRQPQAASRGPGWCEPLLA